MSISRVRISLAFAALAAISGWASDAHAQKPSIARITPYVGYLTFGDYVQGPVGTRLTNESAPVYGVQLGLDVTPNVALVGNVGYSNSKVRVGVPIIGGVNVGDSKVLLYDAGLQLRLPALSALGGGLTPFVEAGAGAIRYDVRTGPLTTTATNFAANFGGGADLQLTRSLGLRAQVKDYVGKFDFREAASFNVDSRVAHNVAFSLGVNLGF
ncbi:MAG: outer membrane beta-barrel protein [Gemmatimonadaceae bacterium]